MKIRSLGLLSIAAVFAFSSAPARALDSLSGTWTGKLSCKGSLAGNATKSKRDLVVRIVDGEGVQMALSADGVSMGETVRVFHAEDAEKTDRAKLAGVSCDLQASSLEGLSLSADAVIKPGSAKGSLKGSLYTVEPMGGALDDCTFSAKRTDVTTPKIEFCVPE
jgi:hypothetical protein